MWENINTLDISLENTLNQHPAVLFWDCGCRALPKHQQAASTHGTPSMINPNNTSYAPAKALRIAGTRCRSEAESRSVVSSPRQNPAQSQHPKRCCFHSSPHQNKVRNHIREPNPAPAPARGLLQHTQASAASLHGRTTRAWGREGSSHLFSSSIAKFQDPSSLLAKRTHLTALLPLLTTPWASEAALSQGFSLGEKPHKCL